MVVIVAVNWSSETSKSGSNFGSSTSNVLCAGLVQPINNDKIINKNGVRIMGESNILNKLPISASSLYAKNVFNFVSNLYDKESKKININLEDEIIEKTLIK